MGQKFKIGELVECARGPHDGLELTESVLRTVSDLGIMGEFSAHDVMPIGLRGIVTGCAIKSARTLSADTIYGVRVYAVRCVHDTRTYIGREQSLRSLDNPPKPEPALTHMHVFRAIHAGWFPCCALATQRPDNTAVKSYWSEREDLGRVKHFVRVGTGETVSIADVLRQFPNVK